MALQYDPPGSYTSTIPSGTTAFRNYLKKKYGFVRTEVIRDQSRCNQTNSEHCVCRGIDFFTTDLKLGRAVFLWCIANADKYGIQSVISNRRVWGFGKWYERHYPPSGNATIEHRDHVHIGLNKWAAKNLTKALLEGGEEFVVDKETEAQVRKIVQEELAKAVGPEYIKGENLQKLLVKTVKGTPAPHLDLITLDLAAIKKALGIKETA